MDPEKVEAAVMAATKLLHKDNTTAAAAAAAGVTEAEKNGSPKEEQRKSPDGNGGGGGGGEGVEGVGGGTISCKRKSEEFVELVDFKVIYNKKKYDVSFSLDADVGALKAHLQPIIDIPPAMMKVMIKGLAKDEMTLRKLGVSKGAKVMVVGSSIKDVLTVTALPSKQELKEEEENNKGATGGGSSSVSQEKMHKKVLDKGKPEDAMSGVKDKKEPLPTVPITGMLNKHGGKVRLTFKMEQDQVWIGTKERTEKVPMNSIKSVFSEPIEGHEEYHMMALQMGPTEASRYWVYWVPAQYVESIKDAILGKWASW